MRQDNEEGVYIYTSPNMSLWLGGQVLGLRGGDTVKTKYRGLMMVRVSYYAQ